MKTPLLALLALTSLSLVGYAIHSMNNQTPLQQRMLERRTRSTTPAANTIVKRPIVDEAPISRIARAVKERTHAPRMPPPEVDSPDTTAPIEPAKTQGVALPITRAVAEATFERLITDLEEKEPENIGKREQDRLYRNVNDAFTALSARVGGDDLELIEDSYQRMQAQMNRLEIEPPGVEYTLPEVID
ncbi:MAG TPA: hypothetical protein ENK31_10845 [Nannocystis exedens]|nr:hypothetical protein [Nannocystis exedens]